MEFGKFFDELTVGEVIEHWPGKTVTEYDHHAFCLLTMVRHPIHLDAHWASTATRHQQPLVIGSYIMSLLIGLSEQATSGRALSHRGFERVQHLAPLMHGDTLYAESEVLSKENLTGKPDRGLVTFETRGHNQLGTLIMAMQRTFVLPKKSTRDDGFS
ncbi:MaoC family dehydratase [Streptomyces sp. V4I8]|uniref:MaoC family dehydratase n=1 Tax=Streptomyces sp. V4I8 TaxID=3156469 RepID=UPI003513F1D5